ncbi:RagB/SusD family nutrient uptake outer membrane protein [Mucilaginibacter sp.]
MKRHILYLIYSVFLLSSCKKLIEVGTPQNQLTTDKVFADTTSATAALVSAYAIFNVSIDPSYNKSLGLYTDELSYTNSATDIVQFNQSKVSPINQSNFTIWTNLYTAIYRCNDIISQVQKSATLPATYISQLTCEAKFLRAYAYFYLVNLYGRVPLLLTTDVNVNAQAAQTDPNTVYQQIISDLKDAQQGLLITYIGPGRVRANKWAAAALLAKVYLFQKDWTDAAAESTAVINSGLYTPLLPPDTVFLANSTETILSFSTINGFITDAPNLIPTSGIPQYAISTSLLGAFEAGDLRKLYWLQSTLISGVVYYYPYKYHNSTANTPSPENLMCLRAGEQYLIRAEAEANGVENGINGAISDLNVIRTRAGLPNYAGATDEKSLLAAILHERRVELFMENGNRFLDLKRSGNIDTVLSAYKSTWTPTADLLPIPQTEITFDNKLIQNTGY